MRGKLVSDKLIPKKSADCTVLWFKWQRYAVFFLLNNNERQNPFPWTSRSCWSVFVMLSDPVVVDLRSLNAAWPEIVLRWPASNDSGWIKTSLGLIGIPDSNAHDSGHRRPCQKPAVVTCPLIIHPKHRNNVSFLSTVSRSKEQLSFLSQVTTNS